MLNSKENLSFILLVSNEDPNWNIFKASYLTSCLELLTIFNLLSYLPANLLVISSISHVFKRNYGGIVQSYMIDVITGGY